MTIIGIDILFRFILSAYFLNEKIKTNMILTFVKH